MELFGHRVRPLLCLGALAFLAMGPGGPCALQAQAVKAKGHRKEWQLTEFTWVKLVPKEDGAAANDQPATVGFETLAAQLEGVRVVLADREEPLFGKDELNDLRKPLSQALAEAGPEEDLLLVSTSRRGANILHEPVAITARLFWKDDGLNLILHDARFPFFASYRVTGHRPDFVFGSRTAAGEVQLQCPGARSDRADWLVLPLPPAPAPQPAPVPPPPPVPRPVPAPQPAPAPQPVPAAAAAPAPGAPAEPAASAPGPRDEAFYTGREQRLRGLKRLRDEDLITEEEFQQKRREIMKDL